MNWKPAFDIPGENKPCTNATVFATEKEALQSASDRFMVWTMPSGFTAIETTDSVNYRYNWNSNKEESIAI